MDELVARSELILVTVTLQIFWHTEEMTEIKDGREGFLLETKKER